MDEFITTPLGLVHIEVYAIRYSLYAMRFALRHLTRFRYFHATSLGMSSVAESKSYSEYRI